MDLTSAELVIERAECLSIQEIHRLNRAIWRRVYWLPRKNQWALAHAAALRAADASERAPVVQSMTNGAIRATMIAITNFGAKRGYDSARLTAATDGFLAIQAIEGVSEAQRASARKNLNREICRAAGSHRFAGVTLASVGVVSAVEGLITRDLVESDQYTQASFDELMAPWEQSVRAT